MAAVSKDPVVINVDLSGDKSIADQIDTPENREAVAEVVRNALGIDGGTGEAHAPDGSLWAEMDTSAQVPPIAFTTARKDIHAALSRTQHALAPDEPDSRPVLTCWWLSVAEKKLTIHTADNYRVARAIVDVLPSPEDAEGLFAIHRTDARKLLAFLASGPDDVWVTAEGGAWSFSHEMGLLTGRVFAGTPPDWTAITEGALPAITGGLNARYVAEAAKAAEAGASGVVRWEYIDERRPVVFRSTALDEWIMPVRLGAPEP